MPKFMFGSIIHETTKKYAKQQKPAQKSKARFQYLIL